MSLWKNSKTLYDSDGFEVKFGDFNLVGRPTTKRIGIRWNGKKNTISFPISRGHPVWLALPNYNCLAKMILSILQDKTCKNYSEEYLKNITEASDYFNNNTEESLVNDVQMFEE